MYTEFWRESRKERSFGQMGVNGRISWISNRIRACVEWINLAGDKDIWQALVNTAMCLWVTQVHVISYWLHASSRTEQSAGPLWGPNSAQLTRDSM
jgi:hypothetical protein